MSSDLFGSEDDRDPGGGSLPPLCDSDEEEADDDSGLSGRKRRPSQGSHRSGGAGAGAGPSGDDSEAGESSESSADEQPIILNKEMLRKCHGYFGGPASCENLIYFQVLLTHRIDIMEKGILA